MLSCTRSKRIVLTVPPLLLQKLAFESATSLRIYKFVFSKLDKEMKGKIVYNAIQKEKTIIRGVLGFFLANWLNNGHSYQTFRDGNRVINFLSTSYPSPTFSPLSLSVLRGINQIVLGWQSESDSRALDLSSFQCTYGDGSPPKIIQSI